MRKAIKTTRWIRLLGEAGLASRSAHHRLHHRAVRLAEKEKSVPTSGEKAQIRSEFERQLEKLRRPLFAMGGKVEFMTAMGIESLLW